MDKNEKLQKLIDVAMDVIDFYAEPGTYFAISFLQDNANPDGLMNDFSDTPELGEKPGKRARDFFANYKEDDLINNLDWIQRDDWESIQDEMVEINQSLKKKINEQKDEIEELKIQRGDNNKLSIEACNTSLGIIDAMKDFGFNGMERIIKVRKRIIEIKRTMEDQI